MEIAGLQKLTLLDYPEKIACTIFTKGCNMRCPFCHNADIVLKNEEHIDTAEVVQFLENRKGKLDAVCISGGEPLLQKDIYEFINNIKEMGYLVKLDSNGMLPDKLKKLIENKKIDYIAMDIKNSEKQYTRTAGKEIEIEAIKQSISLIKNSGIDYEFRTTIVKEFHSKESFEGISELIGGEEQKYYLQAFVDSGNLIEEGLQGYQAEEMKELLEYAKQYIPMAEIRGI